MMKEVGNIFYQPRSGRTRVLATRAAYTQTSIPRGAYLFTAEATAAYFMVGDGPFQAFATEGIMIPRDETLPVYFGQDARLWYYLPAGGTLRIQPVDAVAIRPIEMDAQYKRPV